MFWAGSTSFVLTLSDYNVGTNNLISISVPDSRPWLSGALNSTLFIANETLTNCSAEFTRYSNVALSNICSQKEAVLSAEWSFFCSVGMCQLFNIIICQARKGVLTAKNFMSSGMLFGAIIPVIITMAIGEFRQLNLLFQGRNNLLVHMGWEGICFGLMMLVIYLSVKSLDQCCLGEKEI